MIIARNKPLRGATKVRPSSLLDLTMSGCGRGRSYTDYGGCVGSRYIYDLYYEKEAISKQLYDWLLKNGYADGNLIAKWKKQGYEKVCRSPENPALPQNSILTVQ